MFSLFKSAMTLTEAFVAITDLIKIILLIIVIYKIEAFGSAFVAYTTGVRDAALNASEASKEKVTESYKDLEEATKEINSSFMDLLKKYQNPE